MDEDKALQVLSAKPAEFAKYPYSKILCYCYCMHVQIFMHGCNSFQCCLLLYSVRTLILLFGNCGVLKSATHKDFLS